MTEMNINTKLDYTHHQKWLPLHLQKCKEKGCITAYPHNAMIKLEFDNLYKENQKLKKQLKTFLKVEGKQNKIKN